MVSKGWCFDKGISRPEKEQTRALATYGVQIAIIKDVTLATNGCRPKKPRRVWQLISIYSERSEESRTKSIYETLTSFRIKQVQDLWVEI